MAGETCEFSGLPLHECHLSICDCFDACEQCGGILSATIVLHKSDDVLVNDVRLAEERRHERDLEDLEKIRAASPDEEEDLDHARALGAAHPPGPDQIRQIRDALTPRYGRGSGRLPRVEGSTRQDDE